jgi:hypothetical protein
MFEPAIPPWILPLLITKLFPNLDVLHDPPSEIANAGVASTVSKIRAIATILPAVLFMKKVKHLF